MRIYCPEPLSSHLLFPQFFFRFAPEQKIQALFKDNLPPNFFEEQEYVSKIEEAEVVILVNNFISITAEVQMYIAGHADEAQNHNIPIYTFSCGDLTDSLKFDPRVYVFKYSIYNSTASPRDVSAPTLTEDIGYEGVTLRPKSDLPTVSFCGKAGFVSHRERVGSWLRRIKYELFSIVRPTLRARVRGVFWRSQAINACKNSKLVQTNFIIRKSFSGAMATIELPPEDARKEFIGSIRESDFVLAPKGDGNYSNRFLEALAMGRIPVLIDTDVVLPLDDVIPYTKIVVRVPMSRVRDTARFIWQFYDGLSEEEWQERQKLAREVFEKHLRQDSFFRTYFSLRQTQK